jgi:Domain of unknown function (DUF222)/HNH endonuclease
VCAGDGQAPGSVAEALRAAQASLDYLIPAASELPAVTCGEALTALGEIQAKFTVAQAALLRRFDALDGHSADGYSTSAAWLAAMSRMSARDAKAAVRQMRTLGRNRPLDEALSRGEISASWTDQILRWIKKLPLQLRDDTGTVLAIEKILVQAAASGASLDDLRTIFARAVLQWEAEHPDPDRDDGFDDRFVQVGTTFGGSGVLRGNLTPECAAAVRAVLEALGKKAGPEDTRTEGQRFHDALQLGCELLMRAKMVPDRAGADTQVIAHMPLSRLREMPGGSRIEDAFIRSRLGEDGYLVGKDAEVAACDATTIPVVTGQVDMTVVDKIVELALSAGEKPVKAKEMSPEAWRALRYAIVKLAVDLVSGPAGLAAYLRTQLLEAPWNKPSLPLDVGWSDSIPWYIRKAVLLRDRKCAWPRCGRPAAYCDVHHRHHKKDGGETSVDNCVLVCQFHHDVCIHRWGWELVVHPDGTTSAYGPNGQVIHSHSPPTTRAA